MWSEYLFAFSVEMNTHGQWPDMQTLKKKFSLVTIGSYMDMQTFNQISI